MDNTIPLTKYASRKRNDLRATSRYIKRTAIDRWHERNELAKQLREPLQ